MAHPRVLQLLPLPCLHAESRLKAYCQKAFHVLVNCGISDLQEGTWDILFGATTFFFFFLICSFHSYFWSYEAGHPLLLSPSSASLFMRFAFLFLHHHEKDISCSFAVPTWLWTVGFILQWQSNTICPSMSSQMQWWQLYLLSGH